MANRPKNFDAGNPVIPDVTDVVTMILNNLDVGNFSTDLNVCCPTCEDIYVLSSVETFLKLAEQLGWTLNQGQDITPMPCCLNTESIVETYLKLVEALGINKPDGQVLTCCNNDFDKCVARLSEILTPDQISIIKQVGIVEYSNLAPNGNSLLCNLIDNIITNQLSQNQAYDMIYGVLNKGIVVYCDGCNTLIASIETYLKYWDSTQSNQGPVPA